MTQTAWISLGVIAIATGSATSNPTVAHAADYALTFDLEQPSNSPDGLSDGSLANFSAPTSAPSRTTESLQPAVSDSAINTLPPIQPGSEELLASADLSADLSSNLSANSSLDAREDNQSGNLEFKVDSPSSDPAASPPASSSKAALTPDEVRQNPQFQSLFQDSEPSASTPAPTAKPAAPVPAPPALSEPSTNFNSAQFSTRPYPDLETLFEGGSESLVARSVGSAEGTRRPDGGYNPAYYGHTDPGNGVWNMGSFSYQHGASSPDEADRKQLARLKNQAIELRQKAAAYQMKLDLEEELNGIDLANQAPLAALGREGYIDRLAQAYQMGLLGSEAILWARVRSFLNPDTGQWNAPGLGNTLDGITHDQNRRQTEIQKAIDADPLVKQWKAQ